MTAVVAGVIGAAFQKLKDRRDAALYEAKERWKLKTEVYPALLAFHRQLAPRIVRTWNAHPNAKSRARAFRGVIQKLKTSEYQAAMDRSVILLAPKTLSYLQHFEAFLDELGEEEKYWTNEKKLKQRAGAARRVRDLLSSRARDDLKLRL